MILYYSIELRFSPSEADHVFMADSGDSVNDFWTAITYHSRAWIRNFSLERNPLVVGPLFVSKGPQEGPPDVIHRVETHS